MKKNLISLGALESKGYSFIAEVGVLKVVDGYSKLVIQGKRIRNLYFFSGVTTVGGATVRTEDDEVSSPTKL